MLNPIKHQTILSFDFGLKHIGVAVGQTLTLSARALRSVPAKQGEPDWQQVDRLIETWQPHALVVGIPTKMDGQPLYITKPAKVFSEQLTQRYTLPVHHADERLTTVEARRQTFQQGGYRALRQTDIDSLAAKLILEGWLQDF